jgi:hypothetical protein
MILFDSCTFDRPPEIASRLCRARGCKFMRNRRGSLLVEAGMAAAVMAIVMGMTVKVLSTVAHERRAASDRQQGALEVANLMERITAHAFDQVTPELARRVSVSDRARGALRDCELAIEISGGGKSAAGGQSAKRVMIRLWWKGPGGGRQAPVRLTSWIEPGRPRP